MSTKVHDFYRPGDDLINFKFLFVYILNIFFVFLPLCFYLAKSDDAAFDVCMGICEMIQTIVYNVKLLSILARRREMKNLIVSIEKLFKGEIRYQKKFHEKINN